MCLLFFFFFNDTATTEIYTLSLHDALPISWVRKSMLLFWPWFLRAITVAKTSPISPARDRKSTRLNSSHVAISYAVFCLKKKKHYADALSFEKKKKPKHPQ